MRKYQDYIIIQGAGNSLQRLAGATIAVASNVTGLPAAMFADDEVTPITTLTTDLNGFYSFKAADGAYTGMVSSASLPEPIPISIVIGGENLAAALAQLGESGGGDLVSFQPTGTGAVPMKITTILNESISATRFMSAAQRMNGYLRLGTVDVAAPLQAAINHIKSIGGGCLEFPSGSHFRITAPLLISGNFGYSGIEVRGNRATIDATHNGIAFHVVPKGVDSNDAASEYRQNILIQGFTLQGPGRALTGSVGVQITQGADVQVRDCTIQNFYRNLYGYGALICSFHNLLLQRGDYGIDFVRIPPGAGGHAPEFGPNDVHFYNCRVIDNIHAVRVKDFPNGVVSFHTCEIEGNNLLGHAADGVRVIEFLNAGKVLLNACHIEENPGQYNLYYHGENSNCHLTIIGEEIIPGDSCGNCVYLSNETGAANAANATIIGTRISNNVGSQLYISPGFKVTVIGEIGGAISGNLEKLTYIKGGRIASGTNESPFAQAKFVGDSANGIAIDLKGLARFVDAAGSRLGYFGANDESTYFLSDGTPLLLGTNAGLRINIARLGTATVEPAAAGTYSLGTAAFPWNNVYAKNVVLTPAASVTPAANGELMFQLTSNTALAIKVKGLDGIVRSTTLTLA